METQVECPECGKDMTWVERWQWWECECGTCLFTRFLTLPDGSHMGDGPWDLIRKTPLKLPDEPR